MAYLKMLWSYCSSILYSKPCKIIRKYIHTTCDNDNIVAFNVSISVVYLAINSFGWGWYGLKIIVRKRQQHLMDLFNEDIQDLNHLSPIIKKKKEKNCKK